MKTSTFFRNWLIGLCAIAGLFLSGIAVGQDTYVKVTSEDELVEGNKYLIVCEEANKVLSATSSKNDYRMSVDATVSSDQIILSTATVEGESLAYALTLGKSNGFWTLFDEVYQAYLCLTDNDNKLHTPASPTDAQKSWSISFSGGDAILTSQSFTNRTIRYNSSSPRFACYTSGQKGIQLYKKQEAASCAKPTVLQAIPDVTSVTLSWTAPAEAPANGYSVSITPSIGGESIVRTTTETSLTVNGLAANTDYKWNVISVCGTDDNSEAAEGEPFRTLSTDPQVNPSIQELQYAIYHDQTLNRTLTFSSANLTQDLSVSVKADAQRGGDAVISAAPNTISSTENPFVITLSTNSLSAGTYQDTLLISHDGAVLSKSVINLTVNKYNTPKVVISPNGGIFPAKATVALSCSLADAEIYYTTNGDLPSNTASETCKLYESPFELSTDATVKALAFHDNYNTANDSLAFAEFSFVTITPAALPFSFNGKKADIDPQNGLYESGIDNSDYASAPYLKFNTQGDLLIAAFSSAPGALKYDVKKNGSSEDLIFTVEGSSDGQTWKEIETLSGSDFDNAETINVDIQQIDQAFRYIRWIYTKKGASTNIGLGNIQILPLSTDPILNLTPEKTTLPAVASNGGSASAKIRIFGKNLTEEVSASFIKGSEKFRLSANSFTTEKVMGDGDTLTVTYTAAEAAKDTAVIEIGNTQIKDTLYIYASSVDLKVADRIGTLYADYGNIDAAQLYQLTGKTIVTHKDVNGTNQRIWLQDKDMTDGHSIVIYAQNKEIGFDALKVGDQIGQINGTLSIYNNLLRFIPENTVIEAESHDNPLHIDTVDIDEINADKLKYQSALVCIKDVYFSNTGNFSAGKSYTLTQGENEIVFRTDYKSADYIGKSIPGEQLYVTGILAQYNADMQITARHAADMVTAPCLLPYDFRITTTSTTATISFKGEASRYACRYNTEDADWENAEIDTVYTNSFSLDKLTENTTYYYQIQSLCSETNASEWTATQSFTTKSANAPAILVSCPKADSVFAGDVSVEYTTYNFALGTDGLVKINFSTGDTVYTDKNVYTHSMNSGNYSVSLELVKLADSTSLDEPVRVPDIRFSVDLPDVATPTFDKDPQIVYSDSVVVKISCPTADADIFYSIDGILPWTAYTEAVILKTSSTLEAFAVKEKMDTSAIAKAEYKILEANPTPEGELILNEGFEKATDGYQNTGSECSSSLDNYTVLKGWKGENVYPAESSMKMGTGSKAGKLISPSLDLSYDNGRYYIAFLSMAWRNDATEIKVVAGDTTLYARYLDNSGNYSREIMHEYVFALDNGTENMTISFEALTASSNRFFIDSVRVYQTMPEEPTLTVASTIELNFIQGQSVSENINVKGRYLEDDVTISCPEGNFSIEPASLDAETVMSENGADFQITYNGKREKDSVTLTLQSGELTKKMKVYAIAQPSVENIAALYDFYDNIDKTQAYTVLGDVVVTHKDDFNNRIWVQDAERENGASILIFKAANYGYEEIAVGDVIKNMTGKLDIYNSLLEFLPTQTLTVSGHGHAVYADTLTFEEIQTGLLQYQSALVHVQGVVFTADSTFANGKNYDLIQGEDTITFRTDYYNVDYIGEAIPAGKTDITGILSQYYDNAQLSARNLADITLASSECEAPSNLRITNAESDRATAAWDGQGERYVVALLDAEKDTISTDTVSEKTYTFEGLQTGTTYYWAVATLCEDGSLVWAEGEPFNTPTSNETAAFTKARIYPNPNNGSFYLDIDRTAHVEIFNASGVRLQESEFSAGKHNIRLQQSGIYFIRLQDGQSVAVKRVVVR